jgi:hypothetical protein
LTVETTSMFSQPFPKCRDLHSWTPAFEVTRPALTLHNSALRRQTNQHAHPRNLSSQQALVPWASSTGAGGRLL